MGLLEVHGSDKPGEPGKRGDMINVLESQGEPGKVREKISKILQAMEESGRVFFDKADKAIFRLFLLKLKSKMCVLGFLHDRLLFIFDFFFIGVLIVNCVLYLFFFFFFSEHSCFQGCIAY